MVRAQPMDAVVLMGGCDKTVPAQLMGAASAGKPAIQLIGGPMMTGRYRGERLGACTDCRRFWAQYRAGKIDDAEIADVEGRLATTAGTCAVMGTASTMACHRRGARHDACPAPPPSPPCTPTACARRKQPAPRRCKLIGSRAHARQDRQRRTRSRTRCACCWRIGGSTNAVIHLTAIAGRAGVPVSLQAAQRAVRHHAGAGEPQAGRQRLHGGFLRRRRHRRGAARAEGPAASRLP